MMSCFSGIGKKWSWWWGAHVQHRFPVAYGYCCCSCLYIFPIFLSIMCFLCHHLDWNHWDYESLSAGCCTNCWLGLGNTCPWYHQSWTWSGHRHWQVWHATSLRVAVTLSSGRYWHSLEAQSACWPGLIWKKISTSASQHLCLLYLTQKYV